MELHHKLRRDPNWHPNACNICGGMGHQAANCKTGTIPWREVFGDEAFVVRKPVFWTDVVAKRGEREIDQDRLREHAVAFAREKCEQLGRNYEQEVAAIAESSKSIDAATMLAAKRQQIETEEEQARRAADPAADLPAGWNVAYDTNKKAYFWHSETQKTQWEKPTAQTPIR